MSFTLATLKSTVQDYCETSETTFVSDLDTFIKSYLLGKMDQVGL